MCSVRAKHSICSNDRTTKINNCVRRKKNTCVLGSTRKFVISTYSVLHYISVIMETFQQGIMTQFHIGVTAFNSSKYEEHVLLGVQLLSEKDKIYNSSRRGNVLLNRLNDSFEIKLITSKEFANSIASTRHPEKPIPSTNNI